MQFLSLCITSFMRRKSVKDSRRTNLRKNRHSALPYYCVGG